MDRSVMHEDAYTGVPHVSREIPTIRIEIEPVWRFRREDDGQSMLVMLDFLNEIRATGKITRAAERAHMSYRHCWNLIEKWARILRCAYRRARAGTRHAPHAARGKARLGRAAAAGAAAPAAAEPGAGARDRAERSAAGACPDRARACEPRLRRLQAARAAQPRRRYRGRSALRQQPELAGVARARHLRARRRAPAAGRAARQCGRRRAAMARAARAPRHRLRHARDGSHGQARQPAAHRRPRAAARPGGALREPRSGLRHAPAVRPAAGAAPARCARSSMATSGSSSRTRP